MQRWRWSGRRSRLALLLVVGVCVLALQPTIVRSAPIPESGDRSGADTRLPATLPSVGSESSPDPSAAIGAALQRGQWRRACGIATNTLAGGVANLDALGAFGMCSALRNDKTSTSTALQRLRDAEATPGYYAGMTEGIFLLRNGEADKAESAFKTVMQARPGDPLALYFTGEAHHQLKRDAQAIASFRAVLKRWPDYAPALASSARLLASPKATPQALKEAVVMTERATAIEPMNLDYWKQMAELYDRAGQPERAAAVRLQWLSLPSAN